MKKGETREMYQARKAFEWDHKVRLRLESDERYLEQQLERVRQQLAKRQADQPAAEHG